MTRSLPDSRTLAHLAFVLALTLLLPLALPAQDSHVVSPTELHQAVQSAAQTRQQNLTKVEEFFSRDAAQKALKTARIDPSKVQKAAASLNDDELARLASRTDKVQKDISAGVLTNLQITYIIIALATALIVILIFEA
jgi:uncharacterized protein DUF6627